MRYIRYVTDSSIVLLLAVFCLITGVSVDIAGNLNRAKGLYENKDYDGAIQVLRNITSSECRAGIVCLSPYITKNCVNWTCACCVHNVINNCIAGEL